MSEGWIGCGDCDCVFPCHMGQKRCIRLAQDKVREQALQYISDQWTDETNYEDAERYRQLVAKQKSGWFVELWSDDSPTTYLFNDSEALTSFLDAERNMRKDK